MITGYVLATSSLAHLSNPYFFLSSIYDYRLLGIRSGELVAIVLPHVELGIAICVLIGGLAASSLLVRGIVVRGLRCCPDNRVGSRPGY
ncbi:MAG: hypothetical protein HY288_15570 [Planctomycetia bacterium]|nr:hypothetical protein [Planctomycetia bacterium]